MIPEDRQYFVNLTEAQLMGLCIWAEARGEGEAGRIAVGSVILNRADYGKDHDAWGRRFGTSIHTVILAPAQFSWTIGADPQYARCVKIAKDYDGAYHDHPNLFVMFEIAMKLLREEIPRNVTALYYHTHAVKPKWAREMTVDKVIGNHIFYKG